MPRPRTGSTFPKDGVRQISVLTDRPGAPARRWTRPCPPNADGSPATEADARKAAQDLQRAYDAGRWDPWVTTEAPLPSKAETVAKYAERWLQARERAGLRTVATERGYMTNHIAPVIGSRPIVDVNAADARRVVASLDGKIVRGELHWKSARNAWALVSRMFADACRSKRDDLRVRLDDPTAGVEAPERGVRRAKQFLYPTELAAVLSCPDVALHWRRIFALAVYTYARAGELEALAWDDVDLAHGVLHIHSAADRETSEVRGTKTGNTRRVPIEPSLVPLLRAMHREAGGRGRVIPTMPSRELGASTLRAALKTAKVDRAELFITDRTRKNVTFHDLRATGITWCAVRGDDPIRLQRRAGHSSFATTSIYIREAESLRFGFDAVFPPVPAGLFEGLSTGLSTDAPADIASAAASLRPEWRPQPDSNQVVSERPATSRDVSRTHPEHALRSEPSGGRFATGLSTVVDHLVADVRTAMGESIERGFGWQVGA